MTAHASTASSRPFSILPRDLLGLGPIDVDDVAARLDQLREDQRVTFVRALTKADMIRLWDACRGRSVSATDFVPEDVPDRTEVIHKGKNSLPLFNHFEKRFVRGDRDGVVYGYNHTGGLEKLTLGPGYFTGHVEAEARAPDQQGVFGLDYYRLPPESAALPEGWPRVRKNELGLQCFIYAKMVDYMRTVSQGITIGRAWKRGRRTSNYFVLARTLL